MREESSFENLMGRLRAGDPAAQYEVFHRYTRRLIGLARSQLDSQIRQKLDPEDVAQSVLRSFFVRYAAGRFDARDEASLWGLLAQITVCKCRNKADYFQAARRDVRREASPQQAAESSDQDWLARDREPTPHEAAVLNETLEKLIGRFEHTKHREIITLTLQGFGREEISSQVRLAERTVRAVQDRFRKEAEEMLALAEGS
jgi:DNA-directed RNA polymerase specialized sigma24 family protein